MTYFATLRQPASLCALLGLVGALCLAIVSPALSGCVSTARPASQASLQEPAVSPTTSVAEILRAEVDRWEGTPYRLGGTTRRGVDCSGLMQRIYRDALGVTLSRSTRSQVREGHPVRRSNLRPGDLVFFRTGSKTRHVGVYVGDGDFAHASTSAGPTISPLSRDYWEDAFWTARRVLHAGSDAEEGAPLSLPRATGTGERTGW